MNVAKPDGSRVRAIDCVTGAEATGSSGAGQGAALGERGFAKADSCALRGRALELTPKAR